MWRRSLRATYDRRRATRIGRVCGAVHAGTMQRTVPQAKSEGVRNARDCGNRLFTDRDPRCCFADRVDPVLRQAGVRRWCRSLCADRRVGSAPLGWRCCSTTCGTAPEEQRKLASRSRTQGGRARSWLFRAVSPRQGACPAEATTPDGPNGVQDVFSRELVDARCFDLGRDEFAALTIASILWVVMSALNDLDPRG